MRYLTIWILILFCAAAPHQEDYCTQLSVMRGNLVAAEAREVAKLRDLEAEYAKAVEAQNEAKAAWERARDSYLCYEEGLQPGEPVDPELSTQLYAAWQQAWIAYQVAVMNRQVCYHRLSLQFPIVQDIRKQLSSVEMQRQFYQCE